MMMMMSVLSGAAVCLSPKRERGRAVGRPPTPPHPSYPYRWHCRHYWPATDWGALVSKHNPSLIISVCKEVVLGGRGGSVAGGAGTGHTSRERHKDRTQAPSDSYSDNGWDPGEQDNKRNVTNNVVISDDSDATSDQQSETPVLSTVMLTTLR